jgi:hypothetical protein
MNNEKNTPEKEKKNSDYLAKLLQIAENVFFIGSYFLST